jgi:hypothetical protein
MYQEPAFVMRGQHTLEQVHGRMLMKVGRQVTQAQAVAPRMGAG